MASSGTFLKHPVEMISSLFASAPEPIAPLVVASGSPGAVGASGALSAPLNAASALTQVNAPLGLCGHVPTETGSQDWVCQAFGQVMPGVVFFVSFTVIVITIYLLYRYVRRCRGAVRSFEDTYSSLAARPAIAEGAWASSEHFRDVVQVLAGSAERLPPVGGWVSGINDARVSLKAGGDEVLLSKSVANLAQDETDLNAWTGKSVIDELPTWLTSAGLLTTFIAILLGLQHVKVMSNLEVQGIGGLVNGLSGKFFSSIIALGCALAAAILNFYCSAKVERSRQKLLSRLDALLPHLSVERMMLELFRERSKAK